MKSEKQIAVGRSFFPVELLESVESELRSKAATWASGLESLTFSDRLAYFVLKDTGRFFVDRPEPLGEAK